MIGVIVPAHNEQALIARCLGSLIAATRHPDLLGEEVRIIVVLDACTDRTALITREYGVITACIDAHNVGIARAVGASMLLAANARWLASTDADSVVPADWLAAQLALGADVVCGSIAVADWSEHPAMVKKRFERSYVSADGHRHIHGANFGVAAGAYRRAGGFRPVPIHEDVHLVRALERTGARIAWSAAPRVETSARLEYRTRGGFADSLRALAVE